jgi:hypothetical protein
MQFLHLFCLPLQLRIFAAAHIGGARGMSLQRRRMKVRIIELATSSLTAVAAQILVVATVFI